MIGMGGGFFGSGASRTDTESNASQTTQNATGGGVPISLSNLGTTGKNANLNVSLHTTTNYSDYGAIEAAFGFGNDALSFASNALSDTAAFAYDGISLAADVMNNSANLAYDGLSVAGGLVGDALVMNTDMSLAVLNSSDRFADNAAFLSLEHSKMNAQNTAHAMDTVYRVSRDSNALAYDSMREVGDAYGHAQQGLLAITSDYGENVAALSANSLNNLFALTADNAARLGVVQTDALDVINSNSAAAQSASMKALDYVFESSKSAEERIITDSTKWLIGGIVAVAAVFAFPGLTKAFR